MPQFSINWDYRCPFARNANEHVVAALRGGAPYEVEFLPFSLDQAHVEDGGADVWDDPAKADGLMAMEAGLAVRNLFPERFLDAHIALFAARHDEGKDIRDRGMIGELLAGLGIDAGAVFTEVESGNPREEFRKSHDAAVAEHSVFGVPTFIVGSSAVFVRLMTRPDGATVARSTIDKVLTMIAGSPEINEFKHTTISR